MIRPSTRRVLVLEDEGLIAAMIGQIIDDLGLEVVGPARSLEQALGLIAQAPIDCAILDVNILGETCYPVADELVRQNIPFILTTGYNPSSVEARYNRPIFTKPFAGSVLGKAIMDMLGLSTPTPSHVNHPRLSA
jgi:CheY-like chemotaxis protein